MTSSSITVGSARLRARDLLLASTALVGFRVQPCQAPTVPHAAATRLRERIARWLALAVETPAALVARLNPQRIRKMRPAARIGRRKWRDAMLAAALVAIAPAAQARTTYTWNGADATYGTPTNWTPDTAAPVAAGQLAEFGNAGIAGIAVANPIAPDHWTFNTNA